jgi:uncharacterized protein (DUF1499 family)
MDEKMKFIFFGFGFIVLSFFLLGLKSQKGEAIGLKDGRLAGLNSSPNGVSSEFDTQPEKKVKPLNGNLNEIKRAVTNSGGIITSETETYLSATYMSKIFKFVDDVEFRQSDIQTWEVRSSSRVGYSDRGVNRKRVEVIRDYLTSL